MRSVWVWSVKEEGELVYLVGDIIHNDDSVSTAIVAGSDGAEALLTRRVPLKMAQIALDKQSGKWADAYDLQLNRLPLELDCANLEVHADGGDV